MPTDEQLFSGEFTFDGIPFAVQTNVSSSFISRLVIVQSGLSTNVNTNECQMKF